MQPSAARWVPRFAGASRARQHRRVAQAGLFEQRHHALDEERQLVVEVHERQRRSGKAQPMDVDQRFGDALRAADDGMGAGTAGIAAALDAEDVGIDRAVMRLLGRHMEIDGADIGLLFGVVAVVGLCLGVGLAAHDVAGGEDADLAIDGCGEGAELREKAADMVSGRGFWTGGGAPTTPFRS